MNSISRVCSGPWTCCWLLGSQTAPGCHCLIVPPRGSIARGSAHSPALAFTKHVRSLHPQLQCLDLVDGGLKKSRVEAIACFASCPAAMSVIQQSVSLTNSVELLAPAPVKHFNKVRGVNKALDLSEVQSRLSPSLVLHSL